MNQLHKEMNKRKFIYTGLVDHAAIMLTYPILLHGCELVTKEEKVVLDTSKNIKAFKKAVKFVADIYNSGYMPTGILEWGS
jgi:hypothetical protein